MAELTNKSIAGWRWIVWQSVAMGWTVVQADVEALAVGEVQGEAMLGPTTGGAEGADALRRTTLRMLLPRPGIAREAPRTKAMPRMLLHRWLKREIIAARRPVLILRGIGMNSVSIRRRSAREIVGGGM